MMTAEIVKELTTMMQTSNIMGEQVLSGAKKVEVQRAQIAMLTSIQENKRFDTIRCMKPHFESKGSSQTIKSVLWNNTQTENMASLWEEMHGMQGEQPFPEDLQEPPT